MANYASLISAVQSVIATNGSNAITGSILQQTLLSIINSLGANYQFVGVADGTTTPGTPDQNVVYVGGAGTYPNFNAAVVPSGYLGVFKYNGSWTVETVMVGKDYDQEIREILVDVNGILANMQQSINILPLEYIVATTGYLRRTNGTTVQSGGYGYTDFIPVTYGWKLYLNNHLTTAGTYGCSFLFYDSNKAFLSAVQQVNNTTVPSGAAFVRVNLGNPALFEPGGTLAGQNYALYHSDTMPANYIPFGYEIKDGSVTTEKIANNAITGAKISDKTITKEKIAEDYILAKPGKNLLNPATVTPNSYIDSSNGTVRDGQRYVTDFIPVSINGLYCNVMVFAGIVIGWAVYDSNKQYVRGVGGSGNDEQYTYQSNDAFIRYTISSTDDAIVCVGNSASPYVPYSPIGGYPLNVNMDTLDPSMKAIEAGKNKLNPADVVNDVYVNRNNGNLVSYAGAENPTSATGFIPVSEKGLYFNAGITFGTYCGAAVYDKNKVYIRSCNPDQYVYVNGDGYVRFSFRTANLSTAQVEEGSSGTPYESYTQREIINPDVLPTYVDEDDVERNITVFLPDKIFAVVGDTLQIFFKSIIKAVEPLHYNVLVQCSKGRQYHRYFEYTPGISDVGTVPFKIIVRDDNGYILGSRVCNLVTVDVVSAPATTRNVLCIGASSTANGIWPAEAYRRLTGTGGDPAGKGLANIAFVGSMTRDGASFLGKSGWGWKDYCTAGRPAFRFTIGSGVNVAVGNVYTNNGYSYTLIEISDNGTILCSTSSASNTPQASGNLVLTSGSGDSTVAYSQVEQDSQNPFWDYVNNKLTFIPYANTYCNGHIDDIYIWLGANGLSAWQSDFTEINGYIKTFADTFHTEFPNGKLHICYGNIPSMYLMMPGYGASGTGFADTYGIVTALFNLRQFYQDFVNQDEYLSFCDYSDFTGQFDGDYNYPITDKSVNTRNSDFTEPYANNTIHPGTKGYLQIADAAFRNMIAKICQ